MSNTTRRDPIHTAATAIVIMFALGALAMSFCHVIELAQRHGVTGWESYAAPAFVDGFMLLGRLGMSRRFAESTRRIGHRFMVIGALLSFAANIAVGETIGQRVLGAMVVAGFLAAEWFAGQLAPAPAPVVDPATAAKARRSAAAKKAAATRKANAAKAAKPTRTPRPRAAGLNLAPAAA